MDCINIQGLIKFKVAKSVASDDNTKDSAEKTAEVYEKAQLFSDDHFKNLEVPEKVSNAFQEGLIKFEEANSAASDDDTMGSAEQTAEVYEKAQLFSDDHFKNLEVPERVSNALQEVKEGAGDLAGEVANEADDMMGSFEDELGGIGLPAISDTLYSQDSPSPRRPPLFSLAGGIGLPAISDAVLIEDLFDMPDEVQAEVHGVQLKFRSLPKSGEDLTLDSPGAVHELQVKLKALPESDEDLPPPEGFPAVGALLLFTSTYFVVASAAAMSAPSWLATYIFNLDPGSALAASDEILLRVAGVSLIPAVACMAMQRLESCSCLILTFSNVLLAWSSLVVPACWTSPSCSCWILMSFGLYIALLELFDNPGLWEVTILQLLNSHFLQRAARLELFGRPGLLDVTILHLLDSHVLRTLHCSLGALR
eukprot:gene27441-4743_t